DSELVVLRLASPAGVPIALLWNYAIHGTMLGPRNLKYSGDVMGVASRELERRLRVPALFVNGAVGDVSPRHHGPAAVLAEGRTLATAVEEAWGRAVPAPVGSLAIRTARVRLPAPSLSLRNCTRPWVPRALTVPLGRGLPRETELIAGALGATAWVTIPGELQARLGRRVKEAGQAAGVSAFVAGVSNDYLGYFLTTEDYDRTVRFRSRRRSFWRMRFTADFVVATRTLLSSKTRCHARRRRGRQRGASHALHHARTARRFQGELDRTADRQGTRLHRQRYGSESRGRLCPRRRRGARIRRRAGDRRVVRRVSDPERPAPAPRGGCLGHGNDPGLLGVLRDAVVARGPSDAPRGPRAGARRPRCNGAARHRDGAVDPEGDRAGLRRRPGTGRARGAPDARDVPLRRAGRTCGARHGRIERAGAVLRERPRPRRPECGDDRGHPAPRVARGPADPVARDRRAGRWGRAGRDPAAEPSPVRAPRPAGGRVPSPGARAPRPPAPARGVRSRRGAGDGLRIHAPILAAAPRLDLLSLLRLPAP